MRSLRFGSRHASARIVASKRVRALSAVERASRGPLVGRITSHPLQSRQFASASSSSVPLFVKTEETPNPRSLKFIPVDRDVLPSSFGLLSAEFKDLSDARNVSPLAVGLLQLNGVDSVFLGADFVTVTKDADSQWGQVRPIVTSKLMEVYSDPNFVAVTRNPSEIESTRVLDAHDEDDEVVELILELLEQRIRPMVMEDGGDIHFRQWDEATGVVTVQLSGSCVGCPSSLITLKHGVEQMLKHYIPEVTAVQEAPDETDADDRSLSFTPTTD